MAMVGKVETLSQEKKTNNRVGGLRRQAVDLIENDLDFFDCIWY